MHPVEQHLFATNFKDLAGSRIQGTVALSDELINLGILDLLQGLKSGGGANSTMEDKETSTEETARPDPQAMLGLLDIDQLTVKAKEGRIFLEVDVELKKA